MKKQTIKETFEDMRAIVTKMEHDAHLTTMLYHYGKAAFDRGHRWVPVKKTDLHEYQHYWARRVYADIPHFGEPILCEWTKNGWVNLGHGHLDSTTAAKAIIEVWSH